MMSEPTNKINNPFQLGLLGGLGVLTALAIGGAIASAATILTYVLIALFIALGLEPMVQSLVKLRLKRPLAVTIVIAGFLGFLALLLSAILPTAISEAIKLGTNSPVLIGQFLNFEPVRQLDDQLGGLISNAGETITSFIRNADNLPALLGGVLQVGLGILGGLIGTLVVIILSVYFMASLESMKGYAANLVAASKREKFSRILNQVAISVGRWVMGQTTSALLHALFLFIFLAVIDSPYSLLLSAAGFALAFIPLIGSASAGVVVVVVTLFQSPTMALAALIYYIVYLQLEAYLINPRIMRKAVSIPAGLVVVAALMGGTLGGILGALVAIPTSASILLVIREVWMPRQQLK
jgi:predicted PurR-regulated permease PerM